jgi:ribose 5-phosphate isomerase
MEGDKPYVTDNSNYIVDLYFQVCAAYTPNKSRCIWGLADCGLVMCSRGHGISA